MAPTFQNEARELRQRLETQNLARMAMMPEAMEGLIGQLNHMDTMVEAGMAHMLGGAYQVWDSPLLVSF